MEKLDVYDWDKTLYKKDSTIEFYKYCLKKNKKIIKYFPKQIFNVLLFKITRKEKFKEKFFCFLKEVDNIDKVVEDFWKENQNNINYDLLKKSKNTKVVISASPEFLLDKICKKININKLIATKVNKKTGKFESLNCYGEEKLNRLNKEYKDYEITSFYSDSMSDEFLANLSDESYLIHNSIPLDWKKGISKENTQKKYKYFITYTLVFLILFLGCFAIYFIKYHKAFFRSYDGIDQHYLNFLNCGKWLREIFKNIFINHSFVIPMWNNGIGFGADVLISNGAYYPDIFNWISVFFPSKYAEIGYDFMIFLKIYCVGLAFSYFAFYKKQSFGATLAGTIVYTFCGTVGIVFIESFFINPMYILPFVIVGVDKLLKENNPKVYVLSLAAMFIDYFYFGYMTSIIIVFYFLISYIFDKDINKSFKTFWKYVFRFILYSILAIGISAFVTLPIVFYVFGSSRLGFKYYLPIHYTKDWYKGFFAGFLTNFCMGRDAWIGFGALALVCCIALFTTNKKKFTKQKIEFILITIGLFIPVIGSIFNGLSYYSNRWCFVYALIVGYIVCLMYNEMKNLKSWQFYLCLFALIIYSSVIQLRFKNTSIQFITGILLANTIILVLSIKYVRENKKLYKFIYCFSSIVSMLVFSSFVYRASYGDMTREEVDANSAYDYVTKSGGAFLLDKIDFSDGTRYDKKTSVAPCRNVSWVYGVSGIDHYISLYNNNVENFMKNIGLVTSTSSQEYRGLELRSELSSLMGVNHFITDTDNKENIPYGFDKLEKEEEYNGTTYQVYTSKFDNDLVYGFDKIISQKDYMKLSPFERQEAIMKSIVSEDNSIVNSKLSDLNIDYSDVPYDISFNSYISNNEKKYNLSSYNGEIDLKFDNISNSEIYLYLENVNYEFEDHDSYHIEIKGYKDDEKVNTIYSWKSASNNRMHMYGGRNTFLINLGKGECNHIKISLPIGNYKINDIKVYKRSLDDIDKSISSLNHLDSKVKTSTNKFNININSDKDQYMFISVPYSKGWKAKLDGKEAKIYKVDDAFMAIRITKGTHNIELKYCTPYLKEGFIISFASLITFIIIDKKLKNSYIKKGDINNGKRR